MSLALLVKKSLDFPAINFDALLESPQGEEITGLDKEKSDNQIWLSQACHSATVWHLENCLS